MRLHGEFYKAVFLRRPNRFLAYIRLEKSKKEIQAHVPDPGRLKELFVPKAELIVRKEDNKKRKTQYTVVGIKTGRIWVNIESIFTNSIFMNEHNKIPDFKNYEIIRSEYTYGNSRFDFLMKSKTSGMRTLVEVKGVTLVEDNIALFPDAPTSRGVKHLKELVKATKDGYESFIVFIIKRNDATVFTPNWNTDKKFSEELVVAKENCVRICAVKCNYDPIKERRIDIIESVPYKKRI